MKQHTLAHEADSIDMRSELVFEPAADPRPAVLVFPEAFGLGENARQRARQLASIGYVALACDLHGGGRFVDDLPEALALVQPLLDDPLRARAQQRCGSAEYAGCGTHNPDADTRAWASMLALFSVVLAEPGPTRRAITEASSLG